MKYSGIDLHSNNSVVTVTDEEDRVIAEKRLPNDLAKIIGFLLPWRDELKAVVVESTYKYWLVDGLQEAGFVVKLANTGAIKNTTASSTAATRPMHDSWRTCCGLASCPPALSCHQNSGHYVTLPESACNWCAAAPAIYWLSRTSWRANGR